MDTLIKIVNIAVLTSALTLSGCATHNGPNEQSGMIVGSVLGGLLGHKLASGNGRTAATIFGSMIGASIGGSVGKSMDDTDRLKVAHSLENIRTGVPSSWKNPDSQRRYTMIPTKTTETAQGPCREYSLEAVIGGKTEQIYGEACRQADGSWKIIK